MRRLPVFVLSIVVLGISIGLAISACGPDTELPENSKYESPKSPTYSNGILKFGGFKLKLRNSKDDFDDEYKSNHKINPDDVRIYKSMDGCRGVVICSQFFAASAVDMWLVDYSNKSILYPLKDPGPNHEVTWYGHSYLDILSEQGEGGEAENYCKIMETGPPLQFSCTNPFFFDPKTELFIWGESDAKDDYKAKLVVRRGFVFPKEKSFYVSTHQKDLDAGLPFRSIEEVKTEGKNMIIKYTHGKTVSESIAELFEGNNPTGGEKKWQIIYHTGFQGKDAETVLDDLGNSIGQIENFAKRNNIELIEDPKGTKVGYTLLDGEKTKFIEDVETGPDLAVICKKFFGIK